MSEAILLTPQGPVPAINVPNTQDYPRLALTSPYFSTVPFAELLQPSVNEAVEAILPSLIPPYVQDAAETAVSQLAVLLTGSAMTGPLHLSPLMPTADDQAASKAYVDSVTSALGVPEVPTVPSGQVWARETGQWVPIEQATGVIPEAPTDGRVYARNGQSLSWVPALALTGGTLTGALTLPGDATGPLQAIPLQQLGTQLSNYVPLAGSVSVLGPLTMSGAGSTFTLNGNAATALEAVPLQQLVVTNYVDNSGFIINQRGYTSGTTLAAGAYGLDRWKAGAAGATLTFTPSPVSTVVTITAGSLQQVIEGQGLFTGPYTLSWTGTAQGRIGAGAYAASPVTASATANTNLTIEFATGTLSRVQLEVGSVATAWQPQPIAIEVERCQRFAQNFSLWFIGYAAVPASVGVAFEFPTLMRVAPTVQAQTNNSVNVSALTLSSSIGQTFGYGSAAAGAYEIVVTGFASADL